MKLHELSAKPKLDPNMNNDYEQSKEILEEGFNPEYPVIIDETGEILDGNHRYKLFLEADREEEVEFIMISWKSWDELINTEIDNDTIDKFDNDDDYFYQRIKEVAQL